MKRTVNRGRFTFNEQWVQLLYHKPTKMFLLHSSVKKYNNKAFKDFDKAFSAYSLARKPLEHKALKAEKVRATA